MSESETYTDLEQAHIDALVHTIQRKHSRPTITNLYPVYKDMVTDLQQNCHVRSSRHKKVVAIGALKRIFHSQDETRANAVNAVIEHHTQTIEHLLGETSTSTKRRDIACEKCRQSCILQ